MQIQVQKSQNQMYLSVYALIYICTYQYYAFREDDGEIINLMLYYDITKTVKECLKLKCPLY